MAVDSRAPQVEVERGLLLAQRHRHSGWVPVVAGDLLSRCAGAPLPAEAGCRPGSCRRRPGRQADGWVAPGCPRGTRAA